MSQPDIHDAVKALAMDLKNRSEIKWQKEWWLTTSLWQKLKNLQMAL